MKAVTSTGLPAPSPPPLERAKNSSAGKGLLKMSRGGEGSVDAALSGKGGGGKGPWEQGMEGGAENSPQTHWKLSPNSISLRAS